MNLHTIRIIPKIMNSTMLYPCQFNDEITGELVSLLDRGINGAVHVGPVPVGQSVKELPLNVKSEIKFEMDLDNLTDQNLKNYKGFWQRCPLVQEKGSMRNASKAYFIMEDITEVKSAMVASIKDKRKATQKFETFGLRGQKNIAYFFGVINADKMTEDDLFVHLAEPSYGVLMQPENIQKFLNYNSGDFNTQLAINVSRAIEKGYVEKKSVSGAGDSYFINNHPVGKTESDVIHYLESHNEFYFQFIVEKLGDDAETEKKVKAEDTSRTINTVDENALRGQVKEAYLKLKEMGIKNSMASKHSSIQSVDKLQAALDEANQLIAERAAKTTSDGVAGPDLTAELTADDKTPAGSATKG